MGQKILKKQQYKNYEYKLWPGMVVPVRVPNKGQIKLFNYLTVCKQIGPG